MHLPDGHLSIQVSHSLILFSFFVGSFSIKNVFKNLFEKTKIMMPRLVSNLGTAFSNHSFITKFKFKKNARNRLQQMVAVFGIIYLIQMVDFIKIGVTPGHLIGSVLAALVLGPWAGMAVISAVVTLQAVIMGDGGIVALGANIFNMAVIGTVGGYYLYYGFKKIIKPIWAAGFATWLIMVLMAIGYGLELGISGFINWREHFIFMTIVHILIGPIEAIITIALAKYLFDKKFT